MRPFKVTSFNAYISQLGKQTQRGKRCIKGNLVIYWSQPRPGILRRLEPLG